MTNDVTSCTVNWNDSRSPNVSQFVLSSELGRYIITPEDIHALYSDITVDDLDGTILANTGIESALQDFASGTASFDVNGTKSRIDDEIRQRLTKEVRDELKSRVLQSKFRERIKDQEQPGVAQGLDEALITFKDTARDEALKGKTSLQKFAALTGDFLKFPYQVGSCIFHTGDPVRIFWRDPFNPNDWYFAMTGFGSDWSEQVDANGKQTVTWTVEDPLRMYRLSRVTTNWAIFDVKVLADHERDTLFRSWHSEFLTGLSLPEILYAITFGIGSAGGKAQELLGGDDNTPNSLRLKPIEQFRYGVSDKTPVRPDEGGCGLFNEADSQVFFFGPPSESHVLGAVGDKLIEPIEDLQAWQDQIDHKIPVTVDEIVKLAIPDRRAEVRALFNTFVQDGVVDPQVVMTEIGTHPEIYPVDFGRLMILLPGSLGPGTNRDILINDLVQGIATQTDFVTRLSILYNACERVDFSLYATPRGDIVCEMPLYSFRPEDFGDKYRDRYRFELMDTIGFGSHFSEDQVRTQFRLNWWIIQGRPGLGDSAKLWQQPAVVNLKALVPQFGIRSEMAEPHGYLGSREAAAYYAYLKLMQINANAWQQTIDTNLRLGIGPNRPCWFEARDFIATLRGTSMAIQWGQSGSVSQSVQLNYRRGWSGLLTSEGAHVYEPFGGRAAQPIDYSMLFSLRSNQSSASTKAIEQDDQTFVSETTIDNEIIQRNVRLMREQMQAVAERINSEKGTNITGDQLIGSFVRSEEENRAVGGKANSKHLSGLAVDIPKSKMDKLGLEGDYVASTIQQMQNEGAIKSGRVLWKTPDGDHNDHIHFQLNHSASRKEKFARGEGQ